MAAESAYSEIKQRLKSKLTKLLHEQQDPRVLGYGDVFDSYPFYGRMQIEIPGFKEVGRYNPAFWPFQNRSVPVP